MTAVTADIAADFLVEAGEIVERLGEQLVQLERSPRDEEMLNTVFRGFHTIKGGAGFLHLTALVDLCHAVEELFDHLRHGRLLGDAAMFDLVQRALDEVSTMLAEVGRGGNAAPAPADLLASLRQAAQLKATPPPPPVLVGNPDEPISDAEFEALLDHFHGAGAAPSGLAPAMTPAPAAAPLPSPAHAPVAEEHAAPPHHSHTPAAAESSVRVDTRRLDGIMNLVGELVLARNRLKTLQRRQRNEEFERAVGALDFVTTRLQAAVMRVRMQPVGRAFARFPKLARDVARQLSKEVEIELLGEDTELDKNLVEALVDPLVHLVRNAIDHGIETPDLRQRIGKPRAGQLRLAAQQEGDHILITVSDDGAGIDPERLRDKAREKGLIDVDSAARLSSEECLQLIFLPGFSTKENVTDISGRGVGMDVVKSRLSELNGRVTITSERGRGTRFMIHVPLTLAILPTLLVSAAARQYALPLACVQEVFDYRPGELRHLDGHGILDLRGQTLPLVFLRDWLGADESAPPGSCVVLVQYGPVRYGLVVDQVRGREEVVVKPLPNSVRGLPGLAAATLIGDGSLALILDVGGLAY